MKSFILVCVCMWQVSHVFSQRITQRGSAVAGRPFTLECRVTRAKNDTSYLFWNRPDGQASTRIYASNECKSSIRVSESSRAWLSGGCQHVRGEEVYTVTIENVRQDMDRARWTCQYGIPLDQVILDVKVMVTRVNLTNPSVSVLAGNTSTFTCVTSASKPQACINGYIQRPGNVRELNPLSNCNQDSSSVQTTTRTFMFTASAEDNGAELYCNASNSVTDPPVRSQLHTLNVQYTPQSGVLLSGYVNNKAVESGETLTMTCQVGEANPRPALSWSSGCDQINPVPVNDGSQQISISITVSPSLNQKTCVCKGSQDGALTGWADQRSRTFNVTFGPDSVQLWAGSGQSGNTVTVTENSTANFTCTSGESNPAAVLSWYNKSSPISAAEVSEVSSQRGPNHGYLTTQRYTIRADRYQDGDVIRCEAQRPGNGGTKRMSATLTLNVMYGPMFTSCKSSYIFVENATARLSCTTWAKPEPRFTWTPGAHLMMNKADAIPDNRYTSVLRFDKISRTDSRVYSVTANNNVTRGVERTVNVTVYYPPIVSVVLASGTAREGNPLLLECRAEAVPQNYTYSAWSRTIGDRPVPLTNHSSGKSLSISQVTFRDQGVYRCGATNGFGGIQEGQLEVKVRAPPQFPSQMNKQVAALAENVTLTFKFVSYPAYVNLTWYKLNNGTAERLPVSDTAGSKYRSHVKKAEHEFQFYDTKLMLSGHVAQLEIFDVNRDDSREYKFIAENEEGSSEFNLSFKLIDRPYPPSLATALCENHMANVTWTSCFNGGSTQTFKLQYKQKGGDWVVLPGDIPDPGEGMAVSQVVEGLEEGTKYRFMIYGLNRWNKSDAVEMICTVTVSGPKTGAIAGGVTTAVVMFAAAIIITIVLLKIKRLQKIPPHNQEMAENSSMAACVYQTLNLSPSQPEVPIYVNSVPSPEYENNFTTTIENDSTEQAYERLRTNRAPILDTSHLYENTRLS